VKRKGKIVPEPEPKHRRRLTAAQRRQVILDAAVRCFAGKGVDGTSMDEIAAAAGVTKPVVYDHFASKDDLYLGLLAAMRDRLLEAGEASFRQAAMPEIVTAAVSSLVDFVAENPAAARLLFNPVMTPGAASDGARRIQAEATSGIGALIDRLRPETAGWQNQLLAEFLKQGLHGTCLWWLDHPEVEREALTERLASLCTEVLLRPD
jgi:AcrR family transcriptional regulator